MAIEVGEPKAAKKAAPAEAPAARFPERVTVTMTVEMFVWVEQAAENAGYTTKAAFLRDVIEDYMGQG
jgi:hypothetical protein